MTSERFMFSLSREETASLLDALERYRIYLEDKKQQPPGALDAYDWINYELRHINNLAEKCLNYLMSR